MEEMEYVTLEDGKDYFVMDIIDDYAFLVSENDVGAFCVRKIEKEGEEEFFVGLSDSDEFDEAMLKFSHKHKNRLFEK